MASYSLLPRLSTVGLAAVLALITGAAHADHIKFLDTCGSVDVHVSFNGRTAAYTKAGAYHVQITSGALTRTVNAYSADLAKSVFKSAAWDANPSYTYQGMDETNLPTGIGHALAIDYIVKNYQSASAAQMAIWDLAAGGFVKQTGAAQEAPDKAPSETIGKAQSAGSYVMSQLGPVYSWGDMSRFYATDYGDLKSVYNIETLALQAEASGAKSFSLMEIAADNSGARHPKKLLYSPPLEPIPEPAFYQMGVLLSGGGLMALRRKNKRA